ncbi:hypothetical protein [Hymenobacter sediminicola]|uniref:Uncharacterized protein n=1 Tax=Hymenobacter sediminicola TaxID=2761579 RepID=A0A7G7W4T0_9BACT|nr:hypothetical protein [Hymenobacter sediminicola]QNH61373.1 hypothetical protein H4317_14555 [Hymenobacter sediminicola]
MPNRNLFDTELKAADQAAALQHLQELQKLLPYLRTMQEGDANKLRKMRLLDADLTRKAVEAVEQVPQILPGTFEKDAYLRDGRLLVGTQAIYLAAKALTQQLEDTMRLLHDETAQQTSEVYAAAKQAAKKDAAYRARFEEMERHFASSKSSASAAAKS